jgi:alkanesulfonate monooxygenase SsuD/methylene tetrahydromethanopterin reductase-like flavin-dependent oxidoreductase (luciferase family)
MEVRGRELHVGIQLQAQRTSWAQYVVALQAVEALGFDSAWTFDHLLPFFGPDDGECFETLTTWSAMALLTRRVRIGVLVNCVLYRDPTTLAKAAAQIDQMSGGRMEFSLGAGWAEREFRAYGFPYPPIAERYGRLDEALQIVKLLWSEQRTTFDGRYYRIEDAPCEPKPTQLPLPPITIGGSGLGSLRMAAKHATRWNVAGSPDQCAQRAERLEHLCEEQGRPFTEIELSLHPTVTAVASSHEAAESLAKSIAERHGQDLAFERGNSLIGTPAEVRDQLLRYLELGFSHFVLAFAHPFDLAPLHLIREEVLPALV